MPVTAAAPDIGDSLQTACSSIFEARMANVPTKALVMRLLAKQLEELNADPRSHQR